MTIQPSPEVPKGRKHMIEFDQAEVIAALWKQYPYDMPRAMLIPERTAMVFDAETGTLRVMYETVVKS